MSKFDYTGMYDTVVRLINRFGSTCTVTQINRTDYDPPTDTETRDPPVEQTCNFVQVKLNNREGWNTTIQIGDKEVFFDGQKPVARDDTVKFSDGTVWRIKDLYTISPDDATVLVYMALLRQ